MLDVQKMMRRLLEAGIASRDRIRGCSEEEVFSLQRDIGFELPSAYREFLLAFGHGAGNFWKDVEFTIDKIVQLNRDAVETLARAGALDLFLPVKGLAIAICHGERFLYFLADGSSQNPPLFQFHIGYSERTRVEFSEFAKLSDTFWDGIDIELANLERLFEELPAGKLPPAD